MSAYGAITAVEGVTGALVAGAFNGMASARHAAAERAELRRQDFTQAARVRAATGDALEIIRLRQELAERDAEIEGLERALLNAQALLRGRSLAA